MSPPQRPIVLFIGEAPGKNEIMANRVFVGRSGDLLRRLIDEFGLVPHAIITNAILCAPSDLVRRQPQWWAYPAVSCGDYLVEQIATIQPDIIVCLGKGALQQLLRKNKDVALNRKFTIEVPIQGGEGGELEMGKKEVVVFYTYHPAAVLHNPDKRLFSILRNCFSAVKEEVERMKRQMAAQGGGVAHKPIFTLENLFSNIEAKMCVERHNEELEDFLTYLEEICGDDTKVNVVVDFEIGSPNEDEFDAKAPSSQVVLAGIGNEKAYRAFVFYLVHENLKGSPIFLPQRFTALKDLVLNPRYRKIFHNASFEIMWLLRLFNIYPQPDQFVDTMCLAHSYNETSPSFSLENLVREYLPGFPLADWKKLLPTPNACFIPTKQLIAYNHGDIIATALLYQALRTRIRKEGAKVSKMVDSFHSQVFNKINIFVAHIMDSGIPVSLEAVEEIKNQLTKAEIEYLQRLKAAAPQIQNFNSSKQIIQYLLSLGVDEILEFRTPKGNLSLTKEKIDILAERRPDIPFLQDLKIYREIQKCRSTFIEKVPLWVNKKACRIFPNVHVTGTVSGRITTSNPPLQNFPSEKKEIGKIVRKIFKPQPGYVLITCDAKQHELRILAIKSQDPNLQDAFLSGEDVHKANAAKILKKPIGEVTDAERQIGKRFSFAVVYGASAEGLANIFNIPVEEAEQLLTAMNEVFLVAVQYLERQRDKILFPPHTVHTWLGRISHLVVSELPWDRPLERGNPRVERLRRVAGNFIIQAEASDVWGLIVFEIFRQFHQRGWTVWRGVEPPAANICLTIHDSVILCCKEELVDEVLSIIKRSLAYVSYLFDCLHLPFTAEYAIYRQSLGDAPDEEGEWSIQDIQEEIKKIPPDTPRLTLFKD